MIFIVDIFVAEAYFSKSFLVSTMASADVEMAANAAAPGVNLEMLRQQWQCELWQILVAFKNGMWWMMPHEISDPIGEHRFSGATQALFIWD